MAVSYLVLARKYRPQSFDDLVGQSHVARTLANAIAQNRVAHAFLFTGVRGVGKTTSARLLAKCLSCLGADGKATGPTATPCQVCAACKEIAAGADIDVQAIDGASYNGVDEVRRLQEGRAFRPARDSSQSSIVADRRVLHDLGGALLVGDAAAALRVVDGLASQGFDIPHLARDVMRHLRNLVVAKVCGESGRDMLDLADEEARDVLELAARSDG